MYERENALKEWLRKLSPEQTYQLTPLTGDASFRKYYRIQYNQLTQIVMDAPPGKEDLKSFIHVDQVLAQKNLLVPQIHAVNLNEGFLLLSDLGDSLLLHELNENNAHDYYLEAINVLLQIQQCPIDDPLIPAFNKQFMLKEMKLCLDWFFSAYLNLNLTTNDLQFLNQQLDMIAVKVAEQPLVFIHRDYHSRNLMRIQSQQTDKKIHLGIIDFQDAMVGPLTYDLVSLVKDCYISWPRTLVVAWITYFYQHSSLAQQHYNLEEFIRAVDWCGLQRHLKVLGIFCRLYLRDGKDGYLADLPLTLKYVLECCSLYPELSALSDFIQTQVHLS